MKYRKKPVVIEAVKWEGSKETFDNILSMGLTKWGAGEMGSETFYIFTLEGKMLVSSGDYVIKGIQGEFYPCKPDIFEQTYDAI